MEEQQSSAGAFSSKIAQEGNYFIMDTEQVISNPYQDLQSEALDSAKKSSLTERLTAVRNNVCEHHLRTATSHIDKQRTHSLRDIHMDASNLRYQVKVMDINKRQNELAMQQRILPKKDFTFDSRQIENSSKRLGISSEGSFYLEKKLKYPIRSTIAKDHDQKPFIKKARKTMADYSKQKQNEQEKERAQTARTYDRATTAHTVSTVVEIPSPEPSVHEPKKLFQRGGSKSAPPPKISFNDPHRSTSRLSAIDETDAKLPKLPDQAGSIRQGARSTKSHVTFNVNGNKSKTSTTEGLQRSQTFYSGMTRARPTRSYSEGWDSDSDDDYIYCEKVDLRALFFGDKSQNGDAKSMTTGSMTPRTVPTRMSSELSFQRRSSTALPKVTEEMMLKEQKDIKNKIDKFLGNIQKDETKPKPKVQEKTTAEEMAEKNKKDVLSKAAILLSVFSKPIDHSKTWGYVPPKPKTEVKEETKQEVKEEKPKSAGSEGNNRSKKRWELIKTNVKNGNIHRKYTANDLLLQQLTGILVHSDRKTKIPIHAASRALRHTPTFKMQRVVEELMRQRTRFEQQEVERLQAQEGGSEEDKIGAMVTEESGVHTIIKPSKGPSNGPAHKPEHEVEQLLFNI
ncbi:hypothetical protein MAR_026446 [Mya arenaria]|uniref:Uncharacterized protein n=1 Tax=Mya arenaria TaxID=6604 RepID=A0ABY7EYP1_MYAAR|nr:uncharacterized protein LOC128243307 isoform X2 [Mya arenaria]WAR12266.1 hypothetical protein MAR_026446 [Mya arenaria]